MSEIESIKAESLESGETKSTVKSAVSSTDVGGTHPLPNIYNDSDNRKTKIGEVTANDLPSKKLQYSQWHELRRTDVKGNQLKAPRVRKGPPDGDRQFYELVDDENEKIHHDLKGIDRKYYRNEKENWEQAKIASFTRQELHHTYQHDNLERILARLKAVVYLNLQDNELLSLSTFRFPYCEYINLDENYLTSLRQLPRLPCVKYLTAQCNGIANLDGLSSLTSSPIEELYLRDNPVFFKIGYRYKVFSVLPHLKMLDGILRHEEDFIKPNVEKEDPDKKGCIIS